MSAVATRSCREEKSMSVEEENKALSRRVAEAINGGDLGAFDELFAPDLAQGFKDDVAELKRAIPD